MNIQDLLKENSARIAKKNAIYDPFTGVGAPLERVLLELDDFYLPKQLIPKEMLLIPMVAALMEQGSIIKFLKSVGEVASDDNRKSVADMFIKLRGQHDFYYWAASTVKIKNKEGGGNIPFILNRAQRRLVARYERMRLAGMPIRLILLKARQWGGSTATQIYMAWIQLMHKSGWYSAIVAQDHSSAIRIKEMYSKLLKEYPADLLGLPANGGPLEFGSYGGSTNDYIIKQKGKVARDNVISIGSVVSPDSIRSGDIAMMHASEVSVWKETTEWNADKIIRSVSGAIMDRELTMIVYESTANGTGNFFHNEWVRAKKPEGDPDKSQMVPFFVPWFEIELYETPFASESEKRDFAKWLLKNREDHKADTSPDAGEYYWWLWSVGATLENIHWYIEKRKTYSSHSDMAAEYPSDDIEAFKHSGRKSFDLYKLEELRKSCMRPEFIGDIDADAQSGTNALHNVHLVANERGNLKVWELPDTEVRVSDRYLVIVDPQKGQSASADPSCITVIDRYWIMYGGVEAIVAEWHGSIDMDLLAWKAAQVAKLYDSALLVIERNTYDNVKGKAMDEGEFIIDQVADVYDNMYIYIPAGKVKETLSPSYGWFTNGSTKPTIIHNLIAIVRELGYTEREDEAINELTFYERKEDGNWGAMEKKHDERVITRAIGLYISRSQMSLPKENPGFQITSKSVKSKKY